MNFQNYNDMTLNERLIEALELTADEIKQINAIPNNPKTGRPFNTTKDVTGSVRCFHYQRIVNGKQMKMYTTTSEQEIVLMGRVLNWLLDPGAIQPSDKYTIYWLGRVKNILNNNRFKTLMYNASKKYLTRVANENN